MELLQLKYFLSASKTENFSKTASEFLVPQSTVSQTIKKLETEVGIPLFDRKGNRVYLNENGRLFQNAVGKALTELSTACDTLKNIANGNLGSVSILILTDRRFIAECIAEYKEISPNIRFTIHHRAPKEPCHFDLIVSDRNGMQTDLVKQPLLKEKLLIGVSKNNPLAIKDSLTFDDIKNEAFISMPDDSSLYTHLSNYFAKNNQKPKIEIFCDDPFFIRKYIKLQFGIALWPEFSWRDMQEDDIKLIPLNENGISREIYLFTKSDEISTLAAKNFAKFLIKKSRT